LADAPDLVAARGQSFFAILSHKATQSVHDARREFLEALVVRAEFRGRWQSDRRRRGAGRRRVFARRHGAGVAPIALDNFSRRIRCRGGLARLIHHCG
jgi:hypothetical protein